MAKSVLLDNTVLSNFALVGRTDLVIALWAGACTTPAVMAEYDAGTKIGEVPVGTWEILRVITLTPVETEFATRLHTRLGAGERSCIAVAYHRNGLFVSDDYDARREAQALEIPTTGTIGILLLNIQQERITVAVGNDLLDQLIHLGYRSPIRELGELL